MPGIGRVDPAALVDSPSDRPIQSSNHALDRRLLSLISQKGTDWPALLREANREPQSEDLLPWLSEALHYHLVENDPEHAGQWRLTPAGEQLLEELTRQ